MGVSRRDAEAQWPLLRGVTCDAAPKRDAFNLTPALTLTLTLNPERRQRPAVLQSKTATAAAGRHAVEPPEAKAHVAKASSLRMPIYVPKANLRGAWLSDYTLSHTGPLPFAMQLDRGSS